MSKVTRINVRNGTETEWVPASGELAKLAIGEIAYENDTNRLKVGHETTEFPADDNGFVDWVNCRYITEVVGVKDDALNIIDLDENGDIFAEGYDDTDIVNFTEELRIDVNQLRQTQTTIYNLDQEVDGGALYKDHIGNMFHHQSIKLKPHALSALQVLQNTGDPSAALTDFLNGILNSGVVSVPTPSYEQTILAAYPQDIPGVGLTVTLPCKEATYIDWGDGTVVEGTLTGTDLTHTYVPNNGETPAAQLYFIRAVFEWNNEPENFTGNEDDINKMPWLQEILQFGRPTGQSAGIIASGVCAFAGYSGPKFGHDPSKVIGARALDLSNITDTNRMFYQARELNDDINWVFHTGMTRTYKMFQQAYKFDNGGVPMEFTNLSNVEFIGFMFAQSGISNATMVNLASWDVSNVEDEPWAQPAGTPQVKGGMRRLLNGCKNLSQPNLSTWDVANLSKMRNLEDNEAGLPGQQFFWTQRDNIDQPQLAEASRLPQFGQT